MFGGLFDVITSPFDAIGNLLEGDVLGFFTEMPEALLDADILIFADLGDIASLMDDILDQYPWLKTAIVAAGFAAGGAGGLIAAAAIAATDTMSEINEGTFDLSDLGSGAMEFGALYAGGAAGAGVGLIARAGTTAGQIQLATNVVARSGLLGNDFSRVLGVASNAAAANWSSLAQSAQNAAEALKATGLMGEDGNAVMNAVISASKGDYSGLQAGVTSGLEALKHVVGQEARSYLEAGSIAVNGSLDVSTVSQVVQRSGVLGDDSGDFGRIANVVDMGINTDYSDSQQLVRSGAEAVRLLKGL